MLENEPEGGERTGSQPAGETADRTTTVEAPPGAAPVGGPPPPSSHRRGTGRRGAGHPAPQRATRRRAAPLNQPEQTEAPVEASTSAGSASGEAPQAEVLRPGRR